MINLLDIDDLNQDQIKRILQLCHLDNPPQVLTGKGAALLFEKPSLRTRNSSEMAIVQLGGHPVSIKNEEIGIGTRESTQDIARTLAGYHSLIGARVFEHAKLESMVQALAESGLKIPVINLLSDQAHPTQILADLLTLQDHFSGLEGLEVAYFGDSNNVCKSLVLAAGICKMKISVASPVGYGLDSDFMHKLKRLGFEVKLTSDPIEAAKGCDVLYTDVWTSMGQEDEAKKREKIFSPYQISSKLVSMASPQAMVMHCLPAHRGQEIQAEVIDGSRSLVWQQAKNRMNSFRGFLLWLFETYPDIG